MPENKHLRRALYVLYAVAAAGLVWVLVRYALPWLLPFIVAFAIARLIEPVVAYMTDRWKFRRGGASAICTIIIFAALLALTGLAIGRVVIELTAFVKDLPTLLTSLTKTFSVVGERVDGFVGSAPPEIQNYLSSVMDGFSRKSAELPAELSGKVLTFLTNFAKFTPRLLLFLFTCAISVFFISCSYKDVRTFILRQLPKDRRKSMTDFQKDLFCTFGKWIKAELMLSGVTFIEMAAAFLLMRIEFALLLALLIAVVDALPVLGSGAVLMPWAIVVFIGGNVRLAVSLMLLFAFNSILRSLLEPKFIGTQIGLPPNATLIALYVGFCSTGVAGMVLFPIGLIMLKHLNDKGYLKLWKN
jgi:sporulation integral membrane protein YtvI